MPSMTMELPSVQDSFAVTAEEAERITLMLEKQFAARFTDHDKGRGKSGERGRRKFVR